MVRSTRKANASSFLPSWMRRRFSSPTFQNSFTKPCKGTNAWRPSSSNIPWPRPSMAPAMVLRLSAISASVASSSWALRARMAWRNCSDTRVTFSSISEMRCSWGTLTVRTESASSLMRLIMNQMATATAASSTNITPLITSKRWPIVQAWRWLFMESPAALPPDHQG